MRSDVTNLKKNKRRKRLCLVCDLFLDDVYNLQSKWCLRNCETKNVFQMK